jgi:hypothetical protein
LQVRSGEHFLPSIATRLSFEAWKAAGRNEDMVARERVREILGRRDERPPSLTAEQLADIESDFCTQTVG